MSKTIAMETRIQEAAELADTAFWRTVAECFPEAKTGDFPSDFTYNPVSMVRRWVNANVPRTIEAWAKELNLHNAASWRLLNTGGITVAVTEPLQDGWYVGISSDHVLLYKKSSDEWLEQDTEVGIWTFGSHPKDLMALIEKYLCNAFEPGNAFEPCSLFDDIMTIGKSDKVS